MHPDETLPIPVQFDRSKDAANRRKHGISLRRAGEMEFATALLEADLREEYGEDRYNALGLIGITLYSLTFVAQGEFIRAISLRKATREEAKLYAEYA